jgi:tripartite-type tricarboxylate transporter receptor subunit TctC
VKLVCEEDGKAISIGGNIMIAKEVKMKKLQKALFNIAVPLVVLFGLSESASAQVDFYRGKTVTVVLGTDAAGTTSVRLRTMTPYLRKYIPGNPTVIIDYMEGGGGRKAANHMFRTARPDGLTLGSMSGSMVSQHVLGEAGILYDIDKFIYLGAFDNISHQIFYTRKELGLDTIQKLQAAEGVRLGAQNVGHSGYIAGRFFAYFLNLKAPKFVTGYKGPEVDIALTRGEVDARSNLANSVLLRNPDWVDKEMMDFHAIVEIPKGVKHPHPRFASIRPLQSFVKTESEERLLEVFRSFRSSGSPFVLPPETPKDKVSILRGAIKQMFEDPNFAREYKKLFKEDPLFLSAMEVEKRIRQIPRNPEVNALVKNLAGAGPLPPR